ncbi:hypothetical protein [Flavobacterium terrigena]|uniref:Uncharacterized protein n=1 Tax=Flavobacterium terrigena TaxID=402734 RepID=A0A1H6QPB9_9FLAO|nr:hypothetical protein [Flavobacterium terrigena]SEI42814.1 hypothetical protein SAMN05660918_0509 [Flavobacterium terrigena]
MIVYYCFLEVFDEEIGKWEHVKNPNQHSEDLHYGQFFTEIDRESLFFFFQDLENQQEAVLLPKWRGLPNDASNYVIKNYNHLVEEVKFCNAVSYFHLNELLDFEYDNTFNLYKLPKWEYKNFKEYSYEDKLINNQKQISYRNYLRNPFFDDLNFIKQFERFGKCRIIYFVDTNDRFFADIIEPEPYFKSNNQTEIEIDIIEDDHVRIDLSNYIMLRLFIEKNMTIQNEEVVERMENLGIKIRDIFLDYLNETIPIQEYIINNAKLTQRFWILEKLFAFGYHNGEVNKESIKDFCGDSPIFNDESIEATEHFSMYDYEVEVDCGRYSFKNLFEFEKFKLILRGFCDKWEREIQIMSWLFTKIKKTDNYERFLIELKEKLKNRK